MHTCLKLRFEEVKIAKIPMKHLSKEQRKKISSQKKKKFVADRELERDLMEAEAIQNKQHVEQNVRCSLVGLVCSRLCGFTDSLHSMC